MHFVAPGPSSIYQDEMHLYKVGLGLMMGTARSAAQSSFWINIHPGTKKIEHSRSTHFTISELRLFTHGSEVCFRLCCSFSLVLVKIMVPRIQSFDRGWCEYVGMWVWAGDLQSFHTQIDIYFECYAEYCRRWRGFFHSKKNHMKTTCTATSIGWP